MGKLCSKQVQTTSSSIESEQEVSICSYKSGGDDALKLQENKFNYLNKINFADFLYSLANYSNENATIEFKYDNVNIDYKITSQEFGEDFSPDVFQSFIENRILKHDNIYNAKIDESLIAIFKDNLIQNVTALNLKLKQSHSEDEFQGIRKYHVIPMDCYIVQEQIISKLRPCLIYSVKVEQSNQAKCLMNSFLLYSLLLVIAQ